MELQNKYINTVNSINSRLDSYSMITEELSTKKEELRSALNKMMENKQDKNLFNEYDLISDRVTKLKEEKEINEIIGRIQNNNLLSIEQELLFEAVEIYKNSKYFNKPLGEKTREKIQQLIIDTIKEKYNINVYSYIRIKESYSEDSIVELSINFKDFYYNYDLKNESIIFNQTKNLIDLYYYPEIEFVEIEEIEAKAKNLLKQYKIRYNKIEDLYKQIESIKNENNEDKKGFLDSYRLNCYLNWR